MRGKTFGALLCAAAFMALTGTAHAGYAHVVPAQFGDEVYATFDALPHEAANLRLQVTDGGRTVTFEDLANPISAGTPVTGGGEACEIVSTHKARCTAQDVPFTRVTINTGLREAQVSDLAGDRVIGIDLNSGPLGDLIQLDDQSIVRVKDDGGANEITLGAACVGCHMYGQTVEVGPGASKIDVRNGEVDYVVCVSPHRVTQADNPVVGPGYGTPFPDEYNLLDSLLADANDQLNGCKRS